MELYILYILKAENGMKDLKIIKKTVILYKYRILYGLTVQVKVLNQILNLIYAFDYTQESF